MEAYKRWVRKNSEFVHSLESLANGITWLLPERFSTTEIGPEAVYALLGIASALNQHIVDTSPSRQHLSSEEQSFPWSLCISMLKDMETVVEVGAEHFYGYKRKWNFLVVMEAMKALVRLASFCDSKYHLLLHGGEVKNLKQLSEVPGAHDGGFMSPKMAVGYPGPGQFPHLSGKIPPNLEDRAMAALRRFGDKSQRTSDLMRFNRFNQLSQPPAVAVNKLTHSSIWSQKGVNGLFFIAGEILCIMRPLVYVILIKMFGIRSWKPWFLSLAVDLTGMSFLSYVTSSVGRAGDKFYHLSTPEKDEIKRRRLIWALYVLRDPFFTKYTKPHLEKTDKYLNQFPFVGFITGKVVELLIGAQTRYTYTSGS